MLKVKIFGAGIAALILLSACSRPGTTTTNQRSATLNKQTLSATVSATGNIQPESDAKLTFQVAGQVAEVLKQQGDRVAKGEAIAKLDTTDLSIAVSQAEASFQQAKTNVSNAEQAVIVAQANYSRTVEGARPSDVAAAQAAYNAAIENYNKAKKGPTAQDLGVVEAALRNAEASLKQAQFAYDMQFKLNPAAIGASPAALQLEQATNAYNSAKAQYDKVALGADSAALAGALQQVQSTKAALDKAKEPARSFDVDQVEAQVSQASLQLDNARTAQKLAELQAQSAKRKLEQATLTAPKDGVLSALTAKVGEMTSGQPVATLVDDSKLHIDITVDEIDVAKVKVGQDVVVTLDALAGTELRGKVERISPTSTTINGVVSYVVRVVLTQTSANLRTGMTANASIVLDKRENALVAPNWAIRRDRQTSKSYLTIKNGDKTSEVEVQVGLKNETFTEILGGASEGQVVVAPVTPSAITN
ncbi:MAG TPA: efflux RND transporter periplasmic adaptor subunit [Thermoflexales bacterium]|nr:efflux RND transporter periplasmic adaptor subunit [Thermoflexales bacterium]